VGYRPLHNLEDPFHFATASADGSDEATTPPPMGPLAPPVGSPAPTPPPPAARPRRLPECRVFSEFGPRADVGMVVVVVVVSHADESVNHNGRDGIHGDAFPLKPLTRSELKRRKRRCGRAPQSAKRTKDFVV